MYTNQIINHTCGFEDLYKVNFLNFTLNSDLIKEIIKAWKYLENKQNQIVQIIKNPNDLDFQTDDESFNFQVYKLIICIQDNKSFYIECCDDCCSICYSETIPENEIIEHIQPIAE